MQVPCQTGGHSAEMSLKLVNEALRSGKEPRVPAKFCPTCQEVEELLRTGRCVMLSHWTRGNILLIA